MISAGSDPRGKKYTATPVESHFTVQLVRYKSYRPSPEKLSQTCIDPTPIGIEPSSVRVARTGTDAASLVSSRHSRTVGKSNDTTRNPQGIGIIGRKCTSRIRVNSSLVVRIVVDAFKNVDFAASGPVGS